MSHDSGIELIISQNYSVHNLLLALLEHGWSLNDHGHITLLPLGDNGDFQWTNMNLSEQNEALEIIKQKENLQEIVGISLIWKDTNNVGADVIFQANSIHFRLTINRRCFKSSEFTDVSWYLDIIMPPLVSYGLIIEHITWDEHI